MPFIDSIKINNKVIHQSKLVNYLREDINEKNIQKSLNDILKKTKKNKKYFVSTKDVILLESLKSDGIKISNKYKKSFAWNFYFNAIVSSVKQNMYCCLDRVPHSILLRN